MGQKQVERKKEGGRPLTNIGSRQPSLTKPLLLKMKSDSTTGGTNNCKKQKLELNHGFLEQYIKTISNFIKIGIPVSFNLKKLKQKTEKISYIKLLGLFLPY